MQNQKVNGHPLQHTVMVFLWTFTTRVTKVNFLDTSRHQCRFKMSSNCAWDEAAHQPDQGPNWKKLEAKDILGCIQWKPGTYTVVVKEDNTSVTEDEVGSWV